MPRLTETVDVQVSDGPSLKGHGCWGRHDLSFRFGEVQVVLRLVLLHAPLQVSIAYVASSGTKRGTVRETSTESRIREFLCKPTCPFFKVNSVLQLKGGSIHIKESFFSTI